MAAPITTRAKRLVLAAGAGAVAMYLFDPAQGDSRRGKLRDQAMKAKESSPLGGSSGGTSSSSSPVASSSPSSVAPSSPVASPSPMASPSPTSGSTLSTGGIPSPTPGA